MIVFYLPTGESGLRVFPNRCLMGSPKRAGLVDTADKDRSEVPVYSVTNDNRLRVEHRPKGQIMNKTLIALSTAFIAGTVASTQAAVLTPGYTTGSSSS